MLLTLIEDDVTNTGLRTMKLTMVDATDFLLGKIEGDRGNWS